MAPPEPREAVYNVNVVPLYQSLADILCMLRVGPGDKVYECTFVGCARREFGYHIDTLYLAKLVLFDDCPHSFFTSISIQTWDTDARLSRCWP